jgi:putative membrane protein
VIVAVAWAHASDAPAGLAGGPRPEVAVPLLLAVVAYAVGWWRLSRRAPGAVAARRPVMALVALTALALALLSPLDALADRLFVAHMVQHMLLIMVAAPLLLLANPFAVMLWSWPRGPRARIGRWFARAGALGRLGRAVTMPLIAWIGFAAVVWAWHVPEAYDAALSSRLLHDAEHLTFFAGAVLFWWPVIHPAPRVRPPVSSAVKVVYVVLAAFQTAALGLLLTLAPGPVYRAYATTTLPYGLSALEDQVWGGIVMWAVGGLVDMLVVLALVHRSLGPSARGAWMAPLATPLQSGRGGNAAAPTGAARIGS